MFGEGWRFRAAVLCLLAVFGAEAWSLRVRDAYRRGQAFFTFASLTSDEARLHGSGFGGVRQIAPFVRGIASATPPASTVAISFASEKGDRATYLAAFELAPRRVVSFARLGEADFAALFRAPGDVPPPDGRLGGARGASVPFGELFRLR